MRLLLFTYLFLAAQLVFGHSGYLAGVVTDRANGDPMVGANVFIREISSGTVTDIFGRFRLTLKPGSYTVEVSYIGYGTWSQVVDIREHETIEIAPALEAGALQLSDLVITSNPVAGKTTHLSSIDIALRPVNTSQDVLRMVPGLFIAQHAGGGKAEQIFLRGFDIDHGTDIHLTVDGMPVNMVSHAHGQGYSDLHFLIPETIDDIDFDKGPYQAEKGNFATAGHVAFQTFNTIDKSMVKIEGGSFGLLRNVNMLKLFDNTRERSREQAWVASEFFRSDGYFEDPQGFRRLNVLGRYFNRVNDTRVFSLGISGFSSRWDASGQIPFRAVREGKISRFGAIDNGEGGGTSRYNLNASLTNRIGKSFLEQGLYGSIYDFALLSNFTFFLNDPVNGDRIVQEEARKLAGYNATLRRDLTLHTVDIATAHGAGIRFDAVDDIRLSRVRSWTDPVSDVAAGNIREHNLFAFTNYTFRFPGRFSVTAALRYDRFAFKYDDDIAGTIDRTAKGVFSPKLTFEYNATALTTLFIKAGYGFHSNDARVILGGTEKRILPRAFGADIGTQWKPFRDILVHASLWILDLEQELVYVGDEGIVEPSGATRRKGAELSMRYQISKSFYADADVNYTIARNVTGDDAQKYVPLAPALTTIGGLQYRNGPLTAAVRYRYIGDRPANEDNSVTAKGYLLADATGSWTWKKFTLRLSAENLLNTEWEEAQFDTESRLQDEVEPVSEIHFTPGSPRMLKVSIEIRL